MAQNNVLDISKEWQDAKASIDAHNNSLREAIQLMPQLSNGYKKPSDGSKVNEQMIASLNKANLTIKEQSIAIDNLNKKVIQLAQAKQTLILKDTGATRSGSSNAKTTREQTIATQILRAETDRNIRATTNLGGAYAKASAQLLILKKTAKDYAISLGETHPKTLQAVKDANDLSGRINSADNVVGDFQRNVGNYSNGVTKGIGKLFSGVRQLAYILPGIGIAGILSLAIDPLWELIKGMDLFKTKIDSVKESTKQINQARVDGTKSAQEELSNLKVLLGVAKDETKSKQQRLLAVKELQSTYPDYLGNLSKEKILAGETSEAEKQLTNAILGRAKAQAATAKITENQGKIIDLEEQRLDLRKELDILNKNILTTEDKLRKSDNVTNSQGIALSQMYDKRKSVIKEINKLSGEKSDLDKINNRLTTYAIENDVLFNKEKEKELKTKKEKLALTFAEIESEYNLQKAILERQKAENKDDIGKTFVQRLKMLDDYTQRSVDLANLEAQYKKAKSQESYKNDLEKNNLAFRNKELTTSQHLKNVADITARYSNEIKTIDIERSNNYDALMENDLKTCEQIEAEKRDITYKEQQRIIQHDIDKNKKLADNEENSMALRQKSFEKYIELETKKLEADKIKAIGDEKNVEKIKEITASYDEQIAKLNDLISPTKKYAEELNKAFKSEALSTLSKQLDDLGMGSLQKLLDFTITADGKIQSTFMKMSEALKGSGNEWALYASTLAGVMKDTFNIIYQNKQAVFDEEKLRLQSQYEYQKQFAVGNTEAELELSNQLEKKKREVANREAKAKKQQAVFNITMNMAQGITAALASTPPNPILAGVIGAIGLTQIAFASSQKVPQYYKGRKGGKAELAITNESGAELRTDKYGNIKDLGTNKGARYDWLDEGDIVHTAEQTKKIFSNFGNEKVKQGNNVTTIIKEKTPNDMVHVNIDKNGINTLIINTAKQSIIENKYYKIEGYNV